MSPWGESLEVRLRFCYLQLQYGEKEFITVLFHLSSY